MCSRISQKAYSRTADTRGHTLVVAWLSQPAACLWPRHPDTGHLPCWRNRIRIASLSWGRHGKARPCLAGRSPPGLPRAGLEQQPLPGQRQRSDPLTTGRATLLSPKLQPTQSSSQLCAPPGSQGLNAAPYTWLYRHRCSKGQASPPRQGSGRPGFSGAFLRGHPGKGNPSTPSIAAART